MSVQDVASEEHKRLAVVLAPMVADAIRPSMRSDIWQAGLVCSLVIWTIGYFLVIAKLVDRQPANQINTISVEKEPHRDSVDDLARKVLIRQGSIE